VGRDVTINFGKPEGGQHITDAQRGLIDGQWETDIFVNGSNRRRLFLRLRASGDGRVTGMAQEVDPDDGRRVGPEYGIVDGQMNGNSLSISYFGGYKSQADDWKPIKESLRLEAESDLMRGEYQLSDMAPVDTMVRRVTVAPPLYGH
jgi:hypothetical protein